MDSANPAKTFNGNIVQFVTKQISIGKSNYASLVVSATDTLSSVVTIVLLDYCLTDIFNAMIDYYLLIYGDLKWLDFILKGFDSKIFQTAKSAKEFNKYCLVVEFITQVKFRIDDRNCDHHWIVDFINFSRRLIPSDPSFDQQLADTYSNWKKTKNSYFLPLLILFHNDNQGWLIIDPILNNVVISLAKLTV